MNELPDSSFVRFGDVARWCGLPPRSVRKILEAGGTAVRPPGYGRRLWTRESVLRCFRGVEGGGETEDGKRKTENGRRKRDGVVGVGRGF